MQDKRITIRIPFEIWKGLRELQTMGKISSIQQGLSLAWTTLLNPCKRVLGRTKGKLPKNEY